MKAKHLVTKRTGTLRGDFAELVRDRIREAALELFTEHGFRGTTVRQIAAAAGTTHTTLYKYYTTKEAITFGLLEQIAPTVLEFHKRIVDLIGQPAAFNCWFEEYSNFWFEHRAVYHAFWEAAIGNRKIASSTFRKTRKLLDANLHAAGMGARLNEEQRAKVALWLLSVDNLLALLDLAGDGANIHEQRQNLGTLLESSFAGITSPRAIRATKGAGKPKRRAS